MAKGTETTLQAAPIEGGATPRGDTAAGRSFMQERLALLGKTVFLLAFGFYSVINLLYIASGTDAFALIGMHHNVWHLIAVLFMAALWFLARLRPWPMRTLAAFDTVGLVGAGTALAIMAAMPINGPLMAAGLALTVTMMARAILVPSTARRTLLLSLTASLPLLIVSYVFYAEAAPDNSVAPAFARVVPAVTTMLWLTIAVTLSTVASRTIYGLRQQVREASEIGQYTLEERLGSGGMGEVWRARHRMLIRPAAVKLIRPAAVGSSPGERQLLLRRFEREAHATAGLRSPHTVQLYDFGITDDGTLYYVMELLDGMDLETLVERYGPMPAERAVYLLQQICSSLDDAHQNGLVHRDIKPANVVVSRSRAAWDFVKVLDFGLVKLEGTRQSDASIRLTADGSASGTPAFMAPEVALGEQGTDHRVDVYSLGCVAYWLVTGKLVFEGATAVKVMLEHAHTPPPPPSTRTELPIPPELEAFILDCLEKDPARRPVSAEALQARLLAIPLATPWTRERAEAWWSVHAPGASTVRPVADVLLSQEARPVRVIRQARPGCD